ncbi:MAG TPA: LapA family protein [Alphaproteobacteria bacterium]|nr:LapA family protein [Alphaproteobacteria bacterium]
MSFIRWIIALPIIVGAVLFALANPAIVSVTWSPFHSAIDLPLYFVALAFLGAGFLLGAFVAWIGMGKVRKDRRQQKKTIKQLEKDINAANEKIMTLSTASHKSNNQIAALSDNTLEHDYD